MFTIMENRKRPRLELINTNNNFPNEQLQGVASATSMGTATLATIGGQSFLLSNSASSILPANILLSICDDNSDESEEFIIDSSMLTQIKQENPLATQTNTQTVQHQHHSTLVTTVPQYRIVNQGAKTLNNSTHNSSSVVNSAPVAANSSLISNSVHLPPGCEIYVIKEVIDSPKQVIAESSQSPKANISNTTIKLEPMSPLPLLRNSSFNGNNNQNFNSNSSITINTTSPLTSNTSSTTTPDHSVKRSLTLEAYKKRDDKRRATHNEVERRRRDKINSWIFKLKEMLPSEATPPNSSTTLNKDALSLTTSLGSSLSSPSINQNTNTKLLVQQQGTTTRAPPSDSKSQILIKACEYIKSMQEEIKSLRECLTENENLRLSNQRLQDEINNLRSKQQQQQQQEQQQKPQHNTNNNILLSSNNSNTNNNHNNADDCDITLNSLNTTYANIQLFTPSTNQNNNHHLTGLVGLAKSSNITATTTSSAVNVTYAKRELIITDYVD